MEGRVYENNPISSFLLSHCGTAGVGGREGGWRTAKGGTEDAAALLTLAELWHIIYTFSVPLHGITDTEKQGSLIKQPIPDLRTRPW